VVPTDLMHPFVSANMKAEAQTALDRS